MRTENGEASYSVFKPGVNRDGWWNEQDLVDQFKSVIKIFEKIHPGKVAIFALTTAKIIGLKQTMRWLRAV